MSMTKSQEAILAVLNEAARANVHGLTQEEIERKIFVAAYRFDVHSGEAFKGLLVTSKITMVGNKYFLARRSFFQAARAAADLAVQQQTAKLNEARLFS